MVNGTDQIALIRRLIFKFVVQSVKNNSWSELTHFLIHSMYIVHVYSYFMPVCSIVMVPWTAWCTIARGRRCARGDSTTSSHEITDSLPNLFYDMQSSVP